jgi:hypothetical protein
MCDLFRAAKAHLGEILSAVEFVDRLALESVLRTDSSARDPLGEPFPFYMLIETSGRCVCVGATDAPSPISALPPARYRSWLTLIMCAPDRHTLLFSGPIVVV